MTDTWWYHVALIVLLLVINVVGFSLNIVGLPGNWLVVLASAMFAWLMRLDHRSQVSWSGVGILLVLALIGEGLEFLAGTAGAAKQGASRRAMILSIIGSLTGSITGGVLGLPFPIPLVGSALAALLGGAIGAASGAILGEYWKGRSTGSSWQVGAAAFWGRILGTTGKVLIGAVMLVIATVDSCT